MAAHAEVAPFLAALTPEQTLRLSRPPHTSRRTTDAPSQFGTAAARAGRVETAWTIARAASGSLAVERFAPS